METRNSTQNAVLLFDPRAQLGSPSSRHGLQSFFDRGDQFVYRESLVWNGWRPGTSSGYHIAPERLIATKGIVTRRFTVFDTCSCCPRPTVMYNAGHLSNSQCLHLLHCGRGPPPQTLRNQCAYTTCLYGCKDETSSLHLGRQQQ